MGMTKQDFETVRDGFNNMLEGAVTQITETFMKKIMALEDRLQKAENSLKKAVPDNTPPIGGGPYDY